ncbi:hypothetical protein ACK3TF_004102 [Chlorella vulgaris]
MPHTDNGVSLPAARRLEGQATLLAVAVLWASFTPAVRLIYTLAQPPSPVVLAAGRGLLQLLLLLLAVLLASTVAAWKGTLARIASQAAVEQAEAGGSGDSLNVPLLQGQQQQAQLLVEEEGAGQLPPLPLGMPAAVLAALELGKLADPTTANDGVQARLAWCSVLSNEQGLWMQAVQHDWHAAADHGPGADHRHSGGLPDTSFDAIHSSMAPSRRVWVGSVLALGGTLLIAADRWMLPSTLLSTAPNTAGSAGAAPPSSPLGDALVVAAALCYSAATVRIPAWAVRHTQVALRKSAVLAAVSTAALVMEAARLMAPGATVSSLWPGWHAPAGWAIICWTAVGPGAMAAFLQVKGQRLVSPADAQILFASVPVWSALLPCEAVRLATWGGGACIVVAGVVAAPPNHRHRRVIQQIRNHTAKASSNDNQPSGDEEQAAAAAATAAAVQNTLVLPKGREVEGFACLLIVALLWGSYGPALRLAYTLPGPPTPVAVTAVSAGIELVVLFAAALVRKGARGAATRDAQQQAEAAEAAAQFPWRWLGLPAAVLAGIEMGLYNTAASYTQIAGLALTTATRAAFLVQASILFTPVLSSLAGMAPSRPVWLGSLLALVGTLIITQDPSGGGAALEAAAAAGGAAIGLAAGDALTLLSALCYSVATVRLPVWSVRYKVSPLQISIGKCTVLVLVAAAAASVQAAQLVAAGQPMAALWPGWRQPEGWAIMLWAALGPGALASIMLVKGQSLVQPAAAQIIFCSVPLWSGLLAAAVGLLTVVGGALVAGAGLGQPQRAGRSRAARCARHRLQRSPKQLITVVSAAAGSSSDADPDPEFRPALQPGAAAVPPVAALAPQSGGLVIPHGREVEGLACLFLVSFLWGSYGPALRMAYTLPGPPSPAAVTAITAALELVLLLTIWLAGRGRGKARVAALPGALPAAKDPRLWLGLPAAVLAGLEIGLYNAAATFCEVAALSLTTAVRSTFLLQASLLFTPILSTFAGIVVGGPVWMGSMLALAGTAIITRDDSGSAVAAAGASSSVGGLAAGDAVALLSALCYSFATVRLPVWVVRHRVRPLHLAIGKSAFLLVVGLVAAALQLANSGQSLLALWPGWQQPRGWAIMLYAALGPGALASVLHVKGQGLIAPTPARVIFASSPLFSAVISYYLLPGELVGKMTWVGGSMIAAAGLAAALIPSRASPAAGATAKLKPA